MHNAVDDGCNHNDNCDDDDDCAIDQYDNRFHDDDSDNDSNNSDNDFAKSLFLLEFDQSVQRLSRRDKL